MDFEKVNSLLRVETRMEEHDKSKNSIVQGRDIDGLFHPSALGGCKRRFYYAYLAVPPKHRIPASLRRIFEHGHAVHDWVQSELMHVYNGLEEGGYTFSLECEVSIRDTDFAQDHNMTGRADGLITITSPIGEETRVIYELKTASEKSWTATKSPKAQHKLQANTYAACFGADYILFDYYNKNKDEHKYFLVNADPELQSRVSDMLNDVLDALSNGEEVEREASRWECGTCQYYYECQPMI